MTTHTIFHYPRKADGALGTPMALFSRRNHTNAKTDLQRSRRLSRAQTPNCHAGRPRRRVRLSMPDQEALRPRAVGEGSVWPLPTGACRHDRGSRSRRSGGVAFLVLWPLQEQRPAGTTMRPRTLSPGFPENGCPAPQDVECWGRSHPSHGGRRGRPRRFKSLMA